MCEVGFYQDAEGAASCDPCPEDRACEYAGMTRPSQGATPRAHTHVYVLMCVQDVCVCVQTCDTAVHEKV